MAAARIGVVLVPVDGSEGARKAVAYAAEIARALRVPLQMLYAFPRNAIEMFGMPGEAPTQNQLKYMSEEAFSKLRDDSARRVFDACRKAIDTDGVTVEETLLSGPPAEMVMKHAQQANDPVIVVGSRGLSTFGEVLLGSVSQRLVHHAGCPVTVVR